MKRKMVFASAFYILGLFFALFFAKNIEIIIAVSIICITFKFIFKHNIKDILFIVIFFITAIILFRCQDIRYQQILSYDGENAYFDGIVTNAKFYDQEKALYTLKGTLDGKIEAAVTMFGEAQDVRYGDKLQFEAEFQKFNSTYLFDSETYYKSDNIYLQVKNAETVDYQKCGGYQFRRMLNDYREKTISQFNRKIGVEEGSFLSGLIFGEKSSVDELTKTSLYRSGIGHMLSISGLHVSLIATLLMLVLNKLSINKYLSFSIMLMIIVVFTILVNSPISVIRASVMLVIMHSGRLFLRQSDTLNSLSIAVLIIAIVNPFVIWSAGFWLTVTGTFGMGVFAPYFNGYFKTNTLKYKIIKSTVSVCCTSLIITVPCLLYFDEISLFSPLTNLILMPIFTIIILLGFVYVLTGGMISLLLPCKYMIKLCIFCTNRISKLDYAYFGVNSDNLFIFALGSTVAVICFQLIMKRRKLLLYAIITNVYLFAIFTVYNEGKEYNSLKAAVLGDKSNIVIVVTYQNNTDVIDISGGHKSAQYVRQYLMKSGVKRINSVVLNKRYPSNSLTYMNELGMFSIGRIAVKDMYSLQNIDKTTEFINVGCGKISIIYNSYRIICENNNFMLEYNGITYDINDLISVGTEQFGTVNGFVSKFSGKEVKMRRIYGTD